MSFAQVYTRSVVGLHAPKVIIEVHLSQGLPALTIVGLPEAAVRESKDRVRSAILNSGFLEKMCIQRTRCTDGALGTPPFAIMLSIIRCISTQFM